MRKISFLLATLLCLVSIQANVVAIDNALIVAPKIYTEKSYISNRTKPYATIGQCVMFISANEILCGYFSSDITDLTDEVKISSGETTYPVSADLYGNYLCFAFTNEKPPVQSKLTVTINGESSELSYIKYIEAVTSNDWEFSDHVITAYNGTDTSVTVPNCINNSPVLTLSGQIKQAGTAIEQTVFSKNNTAVESITYSEGIIASGDYVCTGLKSLKSVTLPSTIKEIGLYCFSNTSLESIRIPDGCQYIWALAFENVKTLKGDLNIPGSVEYIGYGAFYNCTGFDGALILNEGTEQIDALAFSGNSTLSYTSLSLPNSLTAIGAYAFQYCRKIKELVLPEGLNLISDGAFNHMSGIQNETLVIPSTVKQIGGNYNGLTGEYIKNNNYSCHVFHDFGSSELFKEYAVSSDNEYFTVKDGVLFNKDMTRLVAYPCGKAEETYEMPDTVKTVDELAFSTAKHLKTIILSNNFEWKYAPEENSLNPDANILSAGIYLRTGVNEIQVKSGCTSYTATDGILYSSDNSELLYVPNNYVGDVTISGGTLSVTHGAFFAEKPSDTKWNNIIFPKSITSIDESVLRILNEDKPYGGKLIISGNDKYTIDFNGNITEYILGDVNLDGSVDIADKAFILKYLLKEEVNINFDAADTDRNGEINLKDALLLWTEK